MCVLCDPYVTAGLRLATVTLHDVVEGVSLFRDLWGINIMTSVPAVFKLERIQCPHGAQKLTGQVSQGGDI